MTDDERGERLHAIAKQLFDTMVERVDSDPNDMMAVLLFMIWHWQVGFRGDDDESKQAARYANLCQLIDAIAAFDINDDGVLPGAVH